MRTKNDYRTESREAFKSFKKKHPNIKLTSKLWKQILRDFSSEFIEYVLETGEKTPLPYGLGYYSIRKRKRNRTKIVNGEEIINLPIDWKRSNELGKRVYHMNYHTEGFVFKWFWNKETARFKQSDFFYFKPSRVASRTLASKLKSDEHYQHIYSE